MAMPTVNSVGTVVSNTTAITVAPGATHTADDIDILMLESGFVGGSGTTLATAEGFVELTAVSPQSTGTGATGTILNVFWRRWNGTDGSPVTNAPSNHVIGRMISISGCKTTGDPWNTTATGTTDSAADTSVSIAGGTTTAANCLILAMVAQSLPDVTSTTEFSNWANADLANVTERIDDAQQFGNGGAIGLATGEKASAGIFGATTADAATSSTRVCAMVALEGAGVAAVENPYPYIGGGYYPTQG